MITKSIYDHLAAMLSDKAGTPVGLCDSRGPPSPDRFSLSGVPSGISLDYVAELIAEHHGLPMEKIQIMPVLMEIVTML